VDVEDTVEVVDESEVVDEVDVVVVETFETVPQPSSEVNMKTRVKTINDLSTMFSFNLPDRF